MIARLPVGAMLRDEGTGCIYLVLKQEQHQNQDVFLMCCFYDPREPDQTQPLKFNFIVDADKAERMTIMNCDVKIDKQGYSTYTLSLMRTEDVISLFDNEDFLRRLISAWPIYVKRYIKYTAVCVCSHHRKIMMKRKLSTFEKVMTRGADTADHGIHWEDFLLDFKPFIPADLDEREHMSSIEQHKFY